MKLIEDSDNRRTTIGRMRAGQVGRTDEGLYYLRSDGAAICLNKIGQSYTQGPVENNSRGVVLIPSGTRLVFEVE